MTPKNDTTAQPYECPHKSFTLPLISEKDSKNLNLYSDTETNFGKIPKKFSRKKTFIIVTIVWALFCAFGLILCKSLYLNSEDDRSGKLSDASGEYDDTGSYDTGFRFCVFLLFSVSKFLKILKKILHQDQQTHTHNHLKKSKKIWPYRGSNPGHSRY